MVWRNQKIGIRNLKIGEKVISLLWSPNADKKLFFSEKHFVDLILKASESEKISINDRVTIPNGLEKSKNR